MRKPTIIEGFKNSQRFRVIFGQGGSEYDIGFYLTIQQMAEDIATANARAAVWDVMDQLARKRSFAQHSGAVMPTGLGMTVRGWQVQVTLC
jgi:hypothetical protein